MNAPQIPPARFAPLRFKQVLKRKKPNKKSNFHVVFLLF